MQTKLETRTRDDFVVLHVLKHLTNASTALAPMFAETFETTGEAVEKEFFVDAAPAGPGYLTIQAYGLEPSKLVVTLNGEPLCDLPELKLTRSWTAWTEVIPAGGIERGRNVLRFAVEGNKQSYLVRDVVVHWHVPEP